MPSRRSLGKRIRKRRIHEKMVFSLIKDCFELEKKKKVPPLVNGHDIMKYCKLKESPLVGDVLTKIREEQLLGRIVKKKEAIDLAKKIVKRRANGS